MYKCYNILLMATIMFAVVPCAQATNENPCATYTDSNKQSICQEMLNNLAAAKDQFIKENSMSTTEVTSPIQPTSSDVTGALKYAFPTQDVEIRASGVQPSSRPNVQRKQQTQQLQKSQQPTADEGSKQHNIFQ